jgi:hypothetical protein
VTSAGVLRLAVLGWGLGHLALGRRAIGLAWLAGEVVAATGVVLLALAYADTSWYLLPFLAGSAFLSLWAVQAASAFRTAAGRVPAAAAASGGSPAAALAWLTVPMLLWGTGLWLVAGEAASPSAVVDRFVSDWAAVVDGTAAWDDGLAVAPSALTDAATGAVDALADRCGYSPDADCDSTAALLRGLRLRLVALSDERATAVAELVRYERRDASFLGIFATTELVPVPVAAVLQLTLTAEPAPYGGETWTITDARRPLDWVPTIDLLTSSDRERSDPLKG